VVPNNQLSHQDNLKKSRRLLHPNPTFAMKLNSLTQIQAEEVEVSIIMPCLNEAETLARCIAKAHYFLKTQGVSGEIIIADNGSSDGSQEIATQLGARVISIAKKGYGNALLGGIREAKGKFIIMGDSDDSYDFSQLSDFIEKLRSGAELVMGNRFTGKIEKGAMPFLHRYLGNPILSFLGRLFFKSRCGDFHCGLRGFNKKSIQTLGLTTVGMEFASEMVVKASLRGLQIEEVPITLHKDGRSRPPHLRSWSDGWRHLKFLLLFSPRWLFFYPGLSLITLGSMMTLVLEFGPLKIGRIYLDVHTLLISSAAIPVGFQFIVFALFAKARGVREGILPPNPKMQKWLKILSIENCVVMGTLLLIAGFSGILYSVYTWASAHQFGNLDPTEQLRIIIPSVLSLSLGTQLFFSGFFIASIQWDRVE